MHTVVACTVAALLLLTSSGCHLWGIWPQQRPAPCVLAPTATKQEIVAHVNRNVTPPGGLPPLTAWRCLQVQLAASGMPPVPATIDVEAPRRMRIRAHMPIAFSEVADFGSNDEEIWIWNQGAPGIVTVAHEDLPRALAQMQVPFEPEWLMEVLGVVPINVDEFELAVPETPQRYVDLICDRRSPTGTLVRRVVRINLCQGRILEHRIESMDGRVIASARVDEYRPDATGQYVLPHFIKIEWPEAKTGMTLRIGDIVVNPPPSNLVTWQVPEKPGVPRIVFPGSGAVPRPQSWREPVLRQAGGESDPDAPARVRLPDLTEDEPPAAYSAGASQSSSGPLPRGPESAPRPFPALP
jgi:hypothetical protein